METVRRTPSSSTTLRARFRLVLLTTRSRTDRLFSLDWLVRPFLPPVDEAESLRVGGTRSFNIDLVDARIKFVPTAENIYESPSSNSSTNATIARRDPFFGHLIPIIADRIARHRDRQNAPGGARRLFSSTPIIGHVVRQTNANRDNRVDNGATGYSDLELPFDGTFDLPGKNTTGKGRVNGATSYRFLIRSVFRSLPWFLFSLSFPLSLASKTRLNKTDIVRSLQSFEEHW